jgi:hypothetical protein
MALEFARKPCPALPKYLSSPMLRFRKNSNHRFCMHVPKFQITLAVAKTAKPTMHTLLLSQKAKQSQSQRLLPQP